VVGEPDALKGELPVAYVQLRAGHHVEPEELLELCQRDVPERAAVPLEIILVETMPVTAIGKIFKPALRLDATRRAARKAVVAALGEDSAVQVEVRDTEARLAAILRVPHGPAAETHADALRKAFAGYLFETRIVIETAPQ